MKRVHPCAAGHVHYCPGCNSSHIVPPGWDFNGSLELPTFSPSVRHRKSSGVLVCHYQITGGQIFYYGDSTHEMRGQTVILPPWLDEGFW